jgi:glycosyltransferase involved in cell wall biosynthesis
MRVDQLVPAFHRGDAIGDTAFHMKEFFLSQGFYSDIYCLTRDLGLEDTCQLFSAYGKPDPTDVAILHYALPSPLTAAFAKLPSRRVILYHNLTPHFFFEGFSPEMVRISRFGREELSSLVPHVSMALADSEFNRQELIQIGYKKTEVFPLFVDFKKYVSPLVRLIVVGKTSSLPRYYCSLVRLADEFYLKPEEICFTGHIPDDEMFSLYKASDVFLSLSEHEGFGLPFIESMIFDLPVIAYDCTAVPFTLDGAGVLIKRKNVDYVAELINVVAHQKMLRQEIILGQRKRLERFKNVDKQEILLRMVNGLKK